MPILTAEALEGFKKYTDRTIAYARYKIGGTYTRVEISRRERLKDGRVAVYFPIDAQGQTDSHSTLRRCNRWPTNGHSGRTM